MALSFLVGNILSLAPATDHDKWPKQTDATGQIFKLASLATLNLIKFRFISPSKSDKKSAGHKEIYAERWLCIIDIHADLRMREVRKRRCGQKICMDFV